MTVTMRASSTCRIWPSSLIVMRDRKPGATTKPMASSAPRPRRESLARRGQEPEQSHGRAGGEVAHRDRPLHHGEERGAADQHHAGEEEEIECERHEEERLADQRQTLPHEIQSVGGVESPFQNGTGAGAGWTSRSCGDAERVRGHVRDASFINDACERPSRRPPHPPAAPGGPGRRRPVQPASGCRTHPRDLPGRN